MMWVRRVICALALGHAVALASFVSTAAADTTHVVAAGEMLGSIAARYGVRVSEIQAWNNLTDDRIRIGQRLTIRDGNSDDSAESEGETIHTVAPGDTTLGICERYHVTLSQLQSWNRNLDPDRIRIGQRITIRQGGSSGSSSSSSSGSGTVYEVAPGDTLLGIAARHGVTLNQLQSWNRNLDPDRIRIGQRITIRSGASASSGSEEPVNYTTYTVVSGDTLSGIAARQGVTMQELQEWNPRLDPDRIRLGQRIRIRSLRPTRTIRYEVQPGDFLGRIASRHNVTVSEILSWNPGVDPDRIRIGHQLNIQQSGPEVPSESIGAAYGGRLVNGEQLPEHPGYRVRRSRRAWGTNETITNLMAGYSYVKRRFPDAPEIAVHDLSFENGGPMSPHRSHQSGRDADIGYYHSMCTETECEYRAINGDQINTELQWALFDYWIRNDLIEYIFVDYRIQEQMVEDLIESGVSAERLGRIFQFPSGNRIARGVIRHEPGHRTHFHVRFSCYDGDERCRE